MAAFRLQGRGDQLQQTLNSSQSLKHLLSDLLRKFFGPCFRTMVPGPALSIVSKSNGICASIADMATETGLQQWYQTDSPESNPACGSVFLGQYSCVL